MAFTARQASMLRFIRGYISEHDFGPTYTEIRDACGISSTSVVDYNLRALERLGHIRRDRETARGITLVGRHRTVTVPIVGILHPAVPVAAYWRESARA